MCAIEEVPALDKKKKHSIDVVIDRLVLPCDRTRLTDSVELALKTGKGVMEVEWLNSQTSRTFSELNACVHCGLSFDELKPRSFSFNSPFGACKTCAGLGQLYYFDEELVVPDRTLPLRECIHPWRRAGHNAIMYYNALRIKMQNRTGSRRMRIWWQKEGGTPSWEARNSATFEVKPIDAGDSVYEVAMPPAGRLKQLRLDFSADGERISGTCRIDYIWLGRICALVQ